MKKRRNSLAYRIMRSIYGPFEIVPSPWAHVAKGQKYPARVNVNPTHEAMWKAAVEYFRRRDYLMLNTCLRNLLVVKR